MRYEFETYESLSKELPNNGSIVLTRDGSVTVLGQDILSQQLLVKTDDGRRIMIGSDEVLSVTQRGSEQPAPRRAKSRRKQQ